MGLKFSDIIHKLSIAVLPIILSKVTPEIKEQLRQFVLDWEKRAQATPNEFDDMLVFCIKQILVIE